MTNDLNITFTDVDKLLYERINKEKTENRVSALLHAKKEERRLKESLLKIQSQIKEAEDGNWKPLVGAFEDDLNFE